MKIKFILVLVSALVLTLSCNNGEEKNPKFKEGIIEYKVTYLENKMSKNIPTNLLPGVMVLKFKNDKSKLTIDGFMGLFSLVIITDHKKKVSTALLKVIGNKYYYTSEPGEDLFCFNEIPGMKIELRKGVKDILGFKAKRGRVIFPESNQEPFLFYYTDGINLRNPNFYNPYNEVDGVLLKFQVNLNKLRMELNAVNVKQKEIDVNDFKVTEEYTRVGRKDMEEILNTLME